MGKKRKAQNNPTNDDNVHMNMKEKRKNVTSQDMESNSNKDDNKNSKQCISAISLSSNDRNPKKIIFVEGEPQEVPVMPSNIRKAPKKGTCKQTITTAPSSSNSGKSKKIIFVGDEPQEVPAVPSYKSNSKDPKKKNTQNNEIITEEDVNDEDIDKFCDELGEEDNKKFENWVQLIEANFNSNKKKTK